MDKKKYSKIASLELGVALRPHSEPTKKIIATKVTGELLETYRKTFLPLLIEVFELRQALSTHKLHVETPELRHLGKVHQTPEEILSRLEEIHDNIQETLLWCNGTIKQVEKAIEEAKQFGEKKQ